MAEIQPFRPAPDVAIGDDRQSATTVLGRRLSNSLVILTIGSLIGFAMTRLPMTMVVGGLLGLASVLIILFKPFLGLILYTLIFTLRLGEIYPILDRLHLERVVGLLTIISLLLEQQRRTGAIHFDASEQTKRLLLFVGAVVLSVPMAYWRAEAVRGLGEVVKILLFYIMIVHLVDTPARLRHFTFLFCLTTIWICGNSLLSYFTGNAAFAQGIERATGTTSAGGNANTLGTTAASALPLLFLLMVNKEMHSIKRWILGFGALALLVTLIITGSRASLLGFCAGLTHFWWRSRNRLLFGFLGVVLLIVGFYVMPEQYQHRYATITSNHLDESSQARVMTWLAGVRLFLGHPLLGVGITCFDTANGGLTGSYLSSHSLYLQVLAELGIVGTVAFVLLFSEMLRLNRWTRLQVAEAPSWGIERAVLRGIFAGFIVLLVSGIFGHSLLRRTWYIYAAMDLVILRVWLLSRAHPAGGGEPPAAPETVSART